MQVPSRTELGYFLKLEGATQMLLGGQPTHGASYFMLDLLGPCAWIPAISWAAFLVLSTPIGPHRRWNFTWRT
jgi:hypothetical protein